MKSRSIAPMRVAKVGYIVLSVAMGSLGAVFIVRPETSAVALGRLCGGLMILPYASSREYPFAVSSSLIFCT